MTDVQTSATACNVCGSRLAPLYRSVRDPQTGEMFRIDRCGGCGLGQTLPQPANLGPYYGAQYHGGRHGLSEAMCMRRRLNFIDQIAAPGRLLDFGCGDGGFLTAATNADWETFGVEVNPDHARATGATVVEQIEQVEGLFNVITLWHSLEHVRSPRDCVANLLPFLVPGGHLIIAVPNWSSLQACVFGRQWFHADVPRHLFHFTPVALKQLLEAAGLTIVRRWNLEAEIDLFGWTQSALNVFLPHPNVLFDTLTRRKRPHGVAEIAVSVGFGTLLTALCAPVLPIAAGLGRGGIMIVAAQHVG